MRKNGRKADELRDITISKNYVMHPEGSVLVAFGNTKVICNATVENNVPRFLKGKNMGWVTAEYGMLPRSTNTRIDRESAKGRQSGRTQEIQRLIGRSLRSVIDLNNLGEEKVKNQPIENSAIDLKKMDTEEMQKDIAVDGTMTHLVVKGDTLYNICKRYDVTVDQLKEWNNLENITIQIGQKLIVSP